MPQEIIEKKEVIQVGEDKAIESNEDVGYEDPRDAIYKKFDSQRQHETGEGEDIKEEPKTTVTVKVFDRESEVDAAVVEEAGGVAAYQKKAAADEILTRAHEQKKEINAQMARLQEIERGLTERQAVMDKTPEPKVAPAELKEMVGQYHEYILAGEIEEASDMLLKIQSAQQGGHVDTAAIANQAVQRARAEIEADNHRKAQVTFAMERNETVRQFFATDPIAKNPELVELVDTKTARLMEDHPEWRPATVMQEAVKSVKDLIGKLKQSKQEIKRGQDYVAGNSAKTEAKPVPKPETASEYIRSLRISRGLET